MCSTKTKQYLGYVYKGSDIFRSVWDRIHYGTDPLCLHVTGSKLGRYGSILDHIHKWTHLVLDSRSYPYRIHQVPRKSKAYPYQFRTGFNRIRSRVNTALLSKNMTVLRTGFPEKARVDQAAGLCYRKEAHHICRVNVRKIISFCHNFFACLENYVLLFVLTLDLIDNALPLDAGR